MVKRSKPEPVDVSEFAPLVAEALAAFGEDFRYAEKMATAAVVINRKRDAWQTRVYWTTLTGQRKAPVGWKLDDAVAQIELALQD